MTAKKKIILKKKITIVPLSLLLIVFLPIFLFQIYHFEKIYPGVRVAGVDLSGRTVDKATIILSEKITPQADLTVLSTLESGESQMFSIPLSSINAKYDFQKSVVKAFGIGRSGNLLYDTESIVKAMFSTKNIGLSVTFSEEELSKHISVLAGSVSLDPVYPSVKIVGSEIVINKGRQGVDLDAVKTRLDIGQKLSFNLSTPIKIEKKIIDPTLKSSEELIFRKRAEALKSKNIKLIFEYDEFNFQKDELLAFLNPYGGVKNEKLLETSALVAKKINRPPQNSTFKFEEGKVKEFSPAKDGIKLDTEKLTGELTKGLTNLENSEVREAKIEVPVEKTKPEIQTSEVNNLGIKELIGRGTSRFRGSIPSRIYNIELASSRLNGILIKPGETLSFNDALGDVSKLTGYKEAYVIKEGKTVLGDGGGVCQVSTTFFRAAMNAGLPIIERRAHAYRVGYYEQDSGPGLDATVYAPTTDLKIKNDTPAHILIQTKVDAKNAALTFELYGTSDGRVSLVTKPKILSQTAPPSDVYQDDPTLPTGTTKQTEHKAWGAKTVFDYTVTKDGQEIYKKNFTSVYRPWAAVYLRGTGQ